MEDIWRVIINPKAGRGRGKAHWPIIEEILNMRGIAHSATISTSPKSAIILTMESIKDGYRKFIAVGGDGTLHEVLCGVMGYSKEHPEFNTADITLAIISIGTGNDWGRLYNIPLEYEQAVDVIAANCTTPQDVAEVNTDNCTSYMINIGGMGFDADVCHYVNRAKYSKHRVLGGSLLYLWSLIKAFVTGKGHHFTIKIDGKEFFNAQAFSVALGIGKYSGGGLIQTPDALPNDGLLDITVIHKANKLKVLTCLTKLFNSTIYQADIVSHAQGAEIDIYSDAKVEVDGENIGDGHIKLRVIPSAIKVAIPR